MIKINLLPSNMIRREERKEIFVFACIFVGFVAVIGGVHYALKFSAYNTVQRRTEIIKQELNNYESIVKQVETLQTTKRGLETRMNVISTLMTRRLIYPQFMETLVKALPGNVWFKSLSTKYDGIEKIVCALSAECSDNYALADLITALASNPKFSGVEVGPISTNASGPRQTSVFSLNFIFKGKKTNG